MIYLSAADVGSTRIPMREVIDLVELALAEHGSGRAEMPAKLGVHPQPGTLLHAMPAWVPAAKAAGMKWVSAFPQNRERGLAAVNALVVVNNPETGLVEGVMDGAWITAMRTAGSTAAAARKLAPLDADTLAIVGPGTLGRANVAALQEVLPKLRRVRAYAPRREVVEQYKRDVEAQHGVAVQPASSAEECVRGAEVLVTCAPWPRLEAGGEVAADFIYDARFVCALDLDATLQAGAVAAADRFFADDVATFESHQQHGVFKGWPKPGGLSQVIAGRLSGRTSPNERIVCANLGIGIYDVVVARRVLDRARERGIGALLSM